MAVRWSSGSDWRNDRAFRTSSLATALVRVAAVGRFGGFVYLFLVWHRGAGEAFLWLALGDLAFSLLHATTLRRVRAN